MSNPTSSKNIVILSTEPWGKMLLSKMHYALALVEKGYKVFFVNPPEAGEGPLTRVVETRQDGHLVIIGTRILSSGLFFRHKFFSIYKLMIRRYVRGIQKIVGGPIDEVWNFNPHVYVDLRSFGARKTLLLIYDFYKGEHVFKTAETADGVVTVSQLILDHYQGVTPPKLLVQHGLGKHFEARSKARLEKKDFGSGEQGKIRIGYVGNLLRVGMNTEVATEIISRHKDLEFHFWGPSSLKNNNVNGTGGTVPQDLLDFIVFLESQPHVKLHGVAEQETLAEGLSGMDAFLFLYSPKKEMNSASNSHKLLEYLSTGRVIVSTGVSNYDGTDLLVMCHKEEEERLPEMFDTVLADLGSYNAEARQLERIRFALDNTYSRQVDRIQEFASTL